MIKYLLFLLVVGCSFPTFGQGRDTVFAVHKLFREKRRSGDGLLAAGDSAASTIKYVEQDASRSIAVKKRPDALGSAVFYGAGSWKASRYSVENEAAIVKRYNEGGSIPPDIRRKLKRKHFHRTAKDVMNP